eukprot:TRINITY_DN13515_c0_g1_i3.p1 TRINITY_DN13515_c0_g1~~TRINITY_DN13515_c0_g1_i3.p1  ORF type:complete len:163 (-),score=6.82 TRINITY_DN13515_c0_g1_i3:542-1030(-)
MADWKPSDNDKYTYHPPAPPVPSAPAQVEMSRQAEKQSDPSLIWEGETWDACPLCCLCCAPLCCSTRKFKITKQRIDMVSGCCASAEDTLDMRRIQDISYRGNCCFENCCCGRGIVYIYSADPSDPDLSIAMCCQDMSGRELYRRIRDAYSNAKIATVTNIE